jgi:predicted DsbA family dithiol-disulfide isomerase
MQKGANIVMLIEVFQDTICPWCRIGKKHLLEAVKRWQGEPVTVRYRTFLLDPSVPKEGLPFRETMAALKGGPQVVEQMLQHATQAGQAAGVLFRFDRVRVRPNTLASHALIKLAPPQKTGDLVEAVYKAYFEDGLDIGNIDVLVAIGEEHGFKPDELRRQIEAGAKQEEIEEDLAYAQELQITGVPFFVIDGKLGLSGAHPAENFLKAFEKVQEMK